jgi:hypothetical protein
MANLLFNDETYEQDLALMMLEVLFKKNQISLNTYNAAKKGLEKEVHTDGVCDIRTTKYAS